MTDSGSLALVIEGFGPGGAQRVASLLLEELARQGQRVHLITWSGLEGDFFNPPAGMPRTVLGGIGASPHAIAGLGANIGRIRRVRRALRRTEARTVLSFLTQTNIVVILASLGLGIRVVVSERNDPSRQDPGRLWGPLRRVTYRLADVVTANTAQALEAMAAYVPVRKLAMIPNPVALPAEPSDPASASTILTIGRLAPQKGHALLVGAFARLEAGGAGWRVAIVGEGPERASLERQIAKAGLGHCADLPGTVPDPERFYRRAAVFALTSAYEGTPNTLLEAMAHGLPCVVPDCLPGALEHVEDGVSGLVYRAGDADDLCRCLTTLVLHPDLRIRLGRAARERMGPLSIDNVIRQWEAVLA